MQHLEFSGAVRHIYASLGFKGLIIYITLYSTCFQQYRAHLQEVKFYCYSIWYHHSP